tara:strand:- start:7454 stop:8575 length:1122 start_codon:yes stop_codon:yes gene_type:complete
MSKRKITRRKILKTAGLISAAGLLSSCSDSGTPNKPGNTSAIIKQKFEWKLVTTWPKNFPGLGTGAQRIADSIKKMSEGKLDIKLFAAGELVPAFECFDAVRENKAQMFHASPYYWINKNKSVPFFGAVPGGMIAQEHNAWINYGGGQELWNELYNDFGLISFMAGNSGTQMGGWFLKKIDSINDFKGLKMRIPGLAAEVLNRIGGTAVALPGGEIMPALQSGAIDATEWVGPWNDLAFGFHKITKFYYGPGIHEPSSVLECSINLNAYNSLPDDLKAIIKFACEAENSRMLSEFTAANSDAQQKLVNDHKVEVLNFPKQVFKEMIKISNDVVAETAEEGNINKRIYDSWSNFKKIARLRSPFAEQGFINLST